MAYLVYVYSSKYMNQLNDMDMQYAKCFIQFVCTHTPTNAQQHNTKRKKKKNKKNTERKKKFNHLSMQSSPYCTIKSTLLNNMRVF